MAGNRRCSAGVLLPGEHRSSNGSIAGLALTSQSPIVAAQDGGRYASGVYNAAIPDNGAKVQRPVRPGRLREIPAAIRLSGQPSHADSPNH